jgi:hypothetical protein
MLSLVKRGKFYSIVTTLPDGKRQWTSTGCVTKFEASKFVPAPCGTSHLSDLSRQTHELLANIIAPFTLENYELAFKHCIGLIGDKNLSEVSKKDVQHLQSYLLKYLATETVNGHMRKLRSAFNYAIAWEMCTVNPFKGVTIFKTETKPRVRLSRSLQRSLGRLTIGISGVCLSLLYTLACGVGKSSICVGSIVVGTVLFCRTM